MSDVFTWNGIPIEGRRVGTDSIHCKRFLQTIGFPSVSFDELNTELRFVDRHLDCMKYRGRPLARTKVTLTDLMGGEIPVYAYTGFQAASIEHFQEITTAPIVHGLIEPINASFEAPTGVLLLNHGIGTKYENGFDSIGYHSDKTQTWRVGSSVVIVSFGAAREFHMKKIRVAPAGEKDEEKVARDKEWERRAPDEVLTFEHGDLFILGWNDNMAYKHSVPPVASELVLDKTRVVEPRISLCFRSIKFAMTKAEVEKKVTRSRKAKVLRGVKKEKERDEKKKKAAMAVPAPY